MSNITFCDSCYPTSFPDCENLSLDLGLAVLTAYVVTITNSKNQYYTQDVSTDAFGVFEIDITGFPEGFFNPFSGFFTLTMVDENGVAVELTVGYSQYDCVSFDIYSNTDANAK